MIFRKQKATFGICFLFVFLFVCIHHVTIPDNMPTAIQEQVDSLLRLKSVDSPPIREWFFRGRGLPKFDGFYSRKSSESSLQTGVHQPKKLNTSLPITKPTNVEDLKTILVWHYAYHMKRMGFGEGQEPFKAAKCKENRCFLTDDRTLRPEEEFDAIIMHFRNLDGKKLPQNRSLHQRWIFYEMESASYIFDHLKKYDGLFNWTATYRRDSDIWSRYGIVEKRKPPMEKDPFDVSITIQKTKQVAWFVSNCWSKSRRENLVKEMQKYIEVDIYGHCGTLKCERTHANDCDHMLERDYKFYLSYENSYCKDYVTEKLFRILRRQVIPVVYGNNHYDQIAPKGSYIDIRNFEDMRALTDYLKYLDRNVTAYNEYFEWKRDYEVLEQFKVKGSLLCDICQKLHEDANPKIYWDLTKWFVSQGQCTEFRSSLRTLEQFAEEFH